MKLTPEQRRLLNLAREAEDGHLNAARGAVLRHFQQVSLRNAEKALKAALSQPAAQRRESLKGVLQLIGEASRATRTPPVELLRVMQRATRDRVLNAQDLAQLADPALVFGDTRELRASAVGKQRAEMNSYWAKESRRFKNDVARTIRDAARKGLDPSQAADLLQDRLKVTRGRAVLIAVDQTRTAAALADAAVQRSAGVKKYDWATTGDNLVRSAHQALNGTRRRWSDRSQFPGKDIACRCRAVPVAPER